MATAESVGGSNVGRLRARKGLEINARTAASKNIEVEVDKPLGLTLGQKAGGGVIITVSLGFLNTHCFFCLLV